MTPIKPGTTVDELEIWGTVAELGAEILEGEGKTFGKQSFGVPGDPLSAGYFGVTRSRFRMVYPFSEHAVVVSGEVVLTNEATGQRTCFKAGDGWFVAKGTPVLWEVVSDNFVKHYLAAA